MTARLFTEVTSPIDHNVGPADLDRGGIVAQLRSHGTVRCRSNLGSVKVVGRSHRSEATPSSRHAVRSSDDRIQYCSLEGRLTRPLESNLKARLKISSGTLELRNSGYLACTQLHKLDDVVDIDHPLYTPGISPSAYGHVISQPPAWSLLGYLA